jgi:hypothetical protein
VIFGYSVAEAKKFVITAITMVAAIVAMFVAYDPAINEAAIGLAGAIIALVGVFMAPQFSPEDFTKGVNAVIGASLALGNFWANINPSTEMKIYSGVGTLVAVAAVIIANNKKKHNAVSNIR